MEQDMACWKVIGRVSQNTVCGLLEGLLEGTEEHSTWLVGRRSNHGNHGTKSILGSGRLHRRPPAVILGNVRNHGHHGQQGWN